MIINLYKKLRVFGLKYFILDTLFIDYKFVNNLKMTLRYNHPIILPILKLLNMYNGFILWLGSKVPYRSITEEERIERENLALEIVERLLKKESSNV